MNNSQFPVDAVIWAKSWRLLSLPWQNLFWIWKIAFLNMVRFLAKLVEKLSRLVSFSGRVQESLPRFLTRLDGFSPRQYLKFDIFWLKWTYLKNLFLQSSSFYSNWILRNKKSDDFQNFWSWWCLSLDGSLGRLGGNLGSLETKCSDLDGFQDFTYCC